jgi:hypothetical protein
MVFVTMEKRSGLIKVIPVKILERDLQKLIIQYLEVLGIYVRPIRLGGNLHTANGKTFVKKNPLAGFPDLLVVYRGLYMHLEVKTPKGRLSTEQIKVIDELRYHGAKVAVVRSIEDVKKALVEIGYFC